LVSSIESEVDLWIVVTTPRVDAVENARRLREELAHEYGAQKVIIAVNQAGGLMTSLALAGTPHELEIPNIQQDDLFFEGRLGRQVLNFLFSPIWREYERARRPGLRLFQRKR
jgi:CO dehydrogenase nickel-insertion accessory protein CooC1